jgi:Na+-transporting methylmalonyl-CoA/oxaloacetate decarboxylase gamma subunit
MEDVNLIGESIKFMVLGMTVVFTFLYILIQAIKLQAKIIYRQRSLINTFLKRPLQHPLLRVSLMNHSVLQQLSQR